MRSPDDIWNRRGTVLSDCNPERVDRRSGRSFGRRATLLLALFVVIPAASWAAGLSGSRSSLHRQNRIARQHDYTYLQNASQVHRFVRNGYLVRVPGNANYELASVSFPYARPEVKTFVERLSRQYRSACGERLVVTSLTRPRSHQPKNASSLSVHPTGMALDLRRPRNGRCRSWLEATLLQLERSEVLDVTRENRPPHYHVAVYPQQYASYVNRLGRGSDGSKVYRVQRGDSLWEIARRFDTTVAVIRQANSLSGNRILPGQQLTVP